LSGDNVNATFSLSFGKGDPLQAASIQSQPSVDAEMVLSCTLGDYPASRSSARRAAPLRA